MITVIMSIGFAVDLSAHIGYAYVKAAGDKDVKAIHALETIGWPVFLVKFRKIFLQFSVAYSALQKDLVSRVLISPSKTQATNPNCGHPCA